MKISKHLLQAVTLGITVAAFSTFVTSCSKEDMKAKKDSDGDGTPDVCDPDNVDYCIACGMG
ncbi:MAG: hypothetical protein V4638_07885 [Bacteroidota bacterium]